MPVSRSESGSSKPDALPDRGVTSGDFAQLSPPERLVWLAKAASLTERSLRRSLRQHAKAAGLNEAELLVLWTTARGGRPGVAQNHLVAEIGLSAAQVSNLLDGLRRGGLVTAQRAENDRRRQTWRLEDSGEKLLSAALGEIACLAEAIFQYLSPEDQMRLEDLLWRVRIGTDQSSQTSRTTGITTRSPDSTGPDSTNSDSTNSDSTNSVQSRREAA
jgi:DNA-binding MarR family transcriptional regulator